MLVLSGGVSMGKYDLVEAVLGGLGRGVFFRRGGDSAGQACRVWTCAGKPVFGLPGNPVSTMVTFELFVAAGDRYAGRRDAAAVADVARRGWRIAVREKGAVTHFLPARVGESRRRAGGLELAVAGFGRYGGAGAGECVFGGAAGETPTGRPGNGLWFCCGAGMAASGASRAHEKLQRRKLGKLERISARARKWRWWTSPPRR